MDNSEEPVDFLFGHFEWISIRIVASLDYQQLNFYLYLASW